MIVLSWLKTSLSMANTELLSWAAALSKIWMNVIIFISPLLLLIATGTCHDIPLFPNQSDWLSRYLRGRYFIAQSSTKRMDEALRLLTMSSLHSSWFTERNKWAFQPSILCLAWEITKASSSFSLSEHLAVANPSSISLTTDETSKQWSQLSQWTWSQVTE